jgi:pimeloyl-ACP methyl ester carboxylesterase
MSLTRLYLVAAAVAVANRSVVAQRTALDRAPSHFASYDGARVHYKSFGTGNTAVIFVHGWNGAIAVWDAQLAAVDGKARAIFVDLPGFGESDKPHIAYTMDYLAGALDAVARDAGAAHAVLVGHSMGTPVIRQFFRRFPSKVVGLVAVDGPLRSLMMDTAQMRKFASQFDPDVYVKTASGMFDGMLATMTDSVARGSVRRIALATPQYVAASAMKGMMDPSIWSDDHITVPVLAIMAPNPGWNADYVAYVKRLAPDIRYEVVPASGHFIMIEHPAEFNALLVEFLKAQHVMH